MIPFVMHRFAALAALAACLACVARTAVGAERASRPNVIAILTDDQGWGDFSFQGNPTLKTPNLDALAGQSVELTQFYVSPVCSPTRASLMTGRYNYRIGAIDTYLGRSTLAADEVTLAEMLAAGGYRTGIFGKWHLGDNYPSRPMDQGFQESLVHRGGGMVQPADPPGSSYFDPHLVHNGQPMQARGYCSDVFTDAAIAFVEKNRAEPFFAYLAFNCPHTPLQVPEEYHRRYSDKGLDGTTAKIFGMVANIDDNVGRLLARLKDLELDDDTIVLFFTDNGPQQPRYNGKLKDLKGSVHDGGIHVTCLLRWPGRFSPGAKLPVVSAHIDIAPTLLAACGVARPEGVKFDGVSLLDVLEGRENSLADRLLFFQWHRGDEPVRYRACAVRGPRYKLVQAAGRGDQEKFEPQWALYDMQADPGERQNLIDEQSALAEQMKAAYSHWFDDVSATRGYPAPKIIAGTSHENPLTLTRQDWRGPKAGWRDDGVGYWDVDFTAGSYDVTVRMPKQAQAAEAQLQIGAVSLSQPLAAGADSVTFRDVRLEAGSGRVQATIQQGDKSVGAHYVDLERKP